MLFKKKKDEKLRIILTDQISKTRLLVYQGKALNVPTVPPFISNNFWEKKILKIYKFWTISKCEIFNDTILVGSLNLE